MTDDQVLYVELDIDEPTAKDVARQRKRAANQKRCYVRRFDILHSNMLLKAENEALKQRLHFLETSLRAQISDSTPALPATRRYHAHMEQTTDSLGDTAVQSSHMGPSHCGHIRNPSGGPPMLQSIQCTSSGSSSSSSSSSSSPAPSPSPTRSRPSSSSVCEPVSLLSSPSPSPSPFWSREVCPLLGVSSATTPVTSSSELLVVWSPRHMPGARRCELEISPRTEEWCNLCSFSINGQQTPSPPSSPSPSL